MMLRGLKVYCYEMVNRICLLIRNKMVKEKYAIRQIDFGSNGHLKYLCKNDDGDYCIIPVYKSCLILFDSKKDAFDFILDKGLDNCEIFGVVSNKLE